MGFPNYQPDVEIVVSHAWHPDQKFVFTFPKKLPQAALDAEKDFLALDEKDRDEKARLGVIKTVAVMSSRAPAGFPGFPDGELTGQALIDAITTYFDDPEQPELETIITAAWTGYKAAARPAAYAKSLSDHGQGDGQSPGAAPKAPS